MDGGFDVPVTDEEIVVLQALIEEPNATICSGTTIVSPLKLSGQAVKEKSQTSEEYDTAMREKNTTTNPFFNVLFIFAPQGILIGSGGRLAR